MPEEQAQPQPQVLPAQAKSVSWSKIILTVLVIVIVTAIIAGAYWYFVLSKPTGEVDTSPIKVSTPSDKKATSSATPSAKKDETAGWKTYINKELGFSIKYPPNWSYNDAAKYESDNCEPGPGVPETIAIFAEQDLKCAGIAAGIGGDFQVSVGSTEYKPLEQLPTQKFEYTVIDGERAAKTYKTGNSEGPWCNCTRIYFNHKGRGYTIEHINKDLQGNYDLIYDQILSTFKFLPSQ